MFRPLLLALGLAAGAAAHAADHPHLAKADSNGDGRVTREEFLAAAAARFDALDGAHRGSLDARDIAAAPQRQERAEQRIAHRLERLDTNGDGRIGADEADAARLRLFQRLDRNGDGVLAGDELAPRGNSAHPVRDKLLARRLTTLDTDRDGRVSQAEFLAAGKARFDQADADRDGRLSAAEMADATDARRTHGAEAMVARLDSNHDGRVSREEFLDAAKARFARRDRNGDGVLDAQDRPPAPH